MGNCFSRSPAPPGAHTRRGEPTPGVQGKDGAIVPAPASAEAGTLAGRPGRLHRRPSAGVERGAARVTDLQTPSGPEGEARSGVALGHAAV